MVQIWEKKCKFILVLSILIFGFHVRNSHGSGPLPGSPFPTQITSAKGDAEGAGCVDAPLPQPPSAEGGGVWFIQQFPCNGGPNQHWLFESQPAGTFLIHSALNPRFCLDLFRGGTTAGTRIQLFPCHGGSNQQWTLIQTDDNTGEISPQTAPDMVLDVANGVARRRADIQTYPRQGSLNQRWRFPVDGLPQGLTGGIAYVNHDCGPNAAAYIGAGLAAIGLIACAVPQIDQPAAWVTSCLQVVQGTSGTIAAGPGAFKSCGDPNVYRSGAVLAAGESLPVATLLLDGNRSSFSVHAAPGWLTMSDGDRGDDRNFGFYHQELSAPSISVSDTSVADRFVLPRGTTCGFHHTRNTAYSVMQRFNLGQASTCLGHDPGQGDCPVGWKPKNHFDMSSGDGSVTCVDLNGAAGRHCDYFAWCEYQDPNRLCDADPNCLPRAHRAGFGLWVGSDVDVNGATVAVRNPPMNDAACPVGWLRTHAYDDGRGKDEGLSWCHPWPDDLPQGLTAGMAYLSAWCGREPVAPGFAGCCQPGRAGCVSAISFCNTNNGSCCQPGLTGCADFTGTGGIVLGNRTPLDYGDGFTVRHDGDCCGGSGFWHQELGASGVTDPALSANLKLIKGAACGFHHTRNSPGLTCMGHDPVKRDCPIGWVARNHFDMSSGRNGACGDLNDQGHCDYFAWCEYQDPNDRCSGDAASECGYWATFIGYTVGIASNTDANGSSLARWTDPTGRPTDCPPGWSPRTSSFDDGRSSGQGISWCMP